MKAILLGVMMAVSAAGLATGVTLEREPIGWFVGEDVEGNLIIEELTTDHAATCGGFAPLQPDECTNGLHVRVSGLSHGFSLMSNCGANLGVAAPNQVGRCYVGTATSQVLFATGARTFVCEINYVPAAPASLGLSSIACAGSGTFPPLGATFEHKCFSDDSGSPGAGNSGTGLGDWRCNLAH